MSRAVGIDVSVYDNTLDPTSLIDFVIMRVSYGAPDRKTYPDRNFQKYYPYSLKKGIRGGYHYMSSHGTWEDQAIAYLSLVNNKDLHFHACDLESAFNDLTPQYVEMSLNWMDYVEKMTGKRAILYTNTSIYQDLVYPYGGERAAKRSLWLAQYQSPNIDFQTANPSMPRGRTDWSIWQFIPGEWGKYGYEFGVGRAGVDANVFNGTEEEMAEWARAVINPSPSEPPPVVTDPTEYSISVSILNIRSAPNLIGARMGQFRKGDKFQLISTSKDAYGNTWGRIAENRYIALVYNGSHMTTWREQEVSPSQAPLAEYAVSTFLLNVRSGPNIRSSSVGKLTRSTKFMLYSIEKDNAGNIWGKIGENRYIGLKYRGRYLTTWKE